MARDQLSAFRVHQIKNRLGFTSPCLGRKEPKALDYSLGHDTFAKSVDLLFGQWRPNKKSAHVCGYNASSVRRDEVADYTAQFPG
jgi:hypothetical protein